MSITTSAAENFQTTGLQKEHVDEIIGMYLQRDDTLYSHIEEATDAIEVSSRAARFPILVLNGSQFSQVASPSTAYVDADFGVASADTYDVLQIQPVAFIQAVALSSFAETFTDAKGKAVRDYAKEQMHSSLAQFKTGLESMTQGAGAGVLDVVISATDAGSGAKKSAVLISNANNFADGQIVDVWSAVGGTFEGSFQVSTADALTKTLFSASDVATLTGGATGDLTAHPGWLLLAHGATGVAGDSYLGIQYYQNNSNTGTLAGINRATYPGRLSTPTINLGGNPITPAVGRRAKQYIRTVLGDANPAAKSLMWYCGLDQQSAIENLALQVAIVNQQDTSKKTPTDMVTKDSADMFVGEKVMTSVHATPGRLDLLALKNWGRTTAKAPQLFETGGQTVFPQYGTSGGISSVQFWYYITIQQLVNRNVRAGAYISDAEIPAGY